MLGTSPVMLRVFDQIERFAASPIPLLILGETGTGKELAARAIGKIGGPHKRFVPVNCGAIHANLIESELFGHERGAFTGASVRRTGLLAQANGGILFLDEVAELSLQAQAELLRVLDTGEYRALGADRIQHSRFRLLAATHGDLEGRVASGAFREDLLYRFGAARLELPPLRHRRSDIPALAGWFLENTRSGGAGGLSDSVVRLLCRCPWPGNVRQLRNVIEAGAAVATDGAIERRHLAGLLSPGERDAAVRVDSGRPPRLAEVVALAEAEAIESALRAAGGDKRMAAQTLGVSLATLYRKLAEPNGQVSGADISQN